MTTCRLVLAVEGVAPASPLAATAGAAAAKQAPAIAAPIHRIAMTRLPKLQASKGDSDPPLTEEVNRMRPKLTCKMCNSNSLDG
jgi:hypothetical protein